jgi:hypothetical protein
MARGEVVEPEAPCALEQLPELDVTVALDARIRGSALGVGLYIGAHDVLLEFGYEVEGVVIQTELLSDAPRVVDVGDRAASGIGVPSPELQGHADDVMALLG